MHVKRFEAATLVEAIQQVKAELGPDALIVSQRPVRRGRGPFGLLGRDAVEVTAAVDRDLRRERERILEEPGPAKSRRVTADRSWQELRLARALTEPLEDELRALRDTVERMAGALPERLDAEYAPRRPEAPTGPQEPIPVDSSRYGYVTRLLGSGLSPQHAHGIADDAPEDADDPQAELEFVLAGRLEERLVPERPDASEPVMLVGPPGVGKTTTLAKLAARQQQRGAAPSLVTLDAQRFGGCETLKRYATRAELPFEVALSPDALRQASARSRRRRLLVDTAGRSASDRDAIRELSACREALGGRVRVHLVLEATTKDEDLVWQLERFRPLRPDGLVITKLDESRSLGNVMNLLLEADAPPLTWVADGQRVPEDLRVPDPETLATQVLGVDT